jgi:hypothetical protein
MNQLIGKIWPGEIKAYLKFMTPLLLITGSIFVYFSITGCCGGYSQPNYGSSDMSKNGNVPSEPYECYMTGDEGPFNPGNLVSRNISTVAFTTFPDTLQWQPPAGISIHSFSRNPDNLNGPLPYYWTSPPESLAIQYYAPSLPTGVNSQVISETVQCSKIGFTESAHTFYATLDRASGQTSKVEIEPTSNPPLRSANIDVYIVQRWTWVNDVSMTTALCQDIYDWLQSDSTFAAMRMPMTLSGGDYRIPLMLPADTNADPNQISNAPKIELNVSGIPDVPLEIRKERSEWMENNLPSQTGEHWVALGVADDPKVTCPSGLNQESWEFYLEFPVDLVGKADTLPLYFCQEGEDPPPIGQTVANLLIHQSDDNSGKTTTGEGITCIGPQDHPLSVTPVIHIGNPAVLWNIIPPKKVQHQHYLSLSSKPMTLNLSIDSDLASAGWTLYKDSAGAPDLSNPIPSTYIATNTFSFFWLVGNIPSGTPSGSYRVAITAVQDGVPETSTTTSDLIWVGQWVPPGGGPTLTLVSPTNGSSIQSVKTKKAKLVWSWSGDSKPNYYAVKKCVVTQGDAACDPSGLKGSKVPGKRNNFSFRISPYKTIYWQVVAYTSKTDKIGTASEIWHFNTPYPPKTPGLLMPAKNGVINTLTPTFTWRQPEPAWAVDHYFLRIKGSADVEIANDPDTPTREYLQPTALNPNSAYSWSMVACNNLNPAQCSKAAKARKFFTPPLKPTLNAVDQSTDPTKPSFSWTGDAYTKKYLLEITPEGGSAPLVSAIIKGTGYTVVLKSGLPSGNYTWRVRGISNFKSTFYEEWWSDLGNFTVP